MAMKGKRTVHSSSTSSEKRTNKLASKSVSSKQASPLQRLFSKQQPKLRITTRTSKLLKLYADNNNVHIAKQIQKWLSKQS